jgi:ankyrin repeat protein
MKTLVLIGKLLLVAAISLHALQTEFPQLTGPYLGQKPPVNEPVLFAPGIVSNGRNHSSVAICPDGKEIYWSMSNKLRKIWFTKLERGKWTEPDVVSFCKDDSYEYDNPFITTDGNKMFFTSFRPGAVSQKKETIWYAERTQSGWSDPKPISSEVNATPLHWSISVSNSGILYFQFQDASGNSPGGIGDIYYSKLANDEYEKPVSIGSAINTPATETCPHIAPDESYIVFTRFDETNVKNTGIFISYKDKSGHWLPAVLAEGGTKEKGGLSPRISPDGKYLFYVNGGMWWMPAKFIEDLRPEELKNGFSQDIHRIVSEGDIEKVELLLRENPLLVNEENSGGRTPIFLAIMQRNPEMVQLLIDKGAVVRTGDSNLRAPIHMAGFMNDMSMMALLLENGAVIDTRAIGAATPLIHSSLSDRFELSRFLIENGADINIQCNSLTTPLYFASLNNNLEYLNYLLGAGADIDTPDFLNRTPLYIAVRDGYLNIAKKLIEHGADFLFKDTHLNRSLLHLAAIQGHKEIVELLIQEGLDINGNDAQEYTPLDYAHRYGHASVSEFLENNGGRAGEFVDLASAKDVQNKDVKHGEAVIVKLQNGSWGIHTQKHFLILAYSEIGNPPPEKSIVNGYLTSDEMKYLFWVYVDMSFHPPKAGYSLQSQTPIYSMQDRVKNLLFILNAALDRNYSGMNLSQVHFPKPGQPLDVEGLKVSVIPSYQNKVGYFIECDGLSVFWLSGLSDDYITSKKDTKAVEFVRDSFPGVNLMFLGTPDGIGPEKGNGIREAYLESTCLNPDAVFFMGKEHLARRILYQIKRRIQNPKNIYCAENPGDMFFYVQGEIRKNR